MRIRLCGEEVVALSIVGQSPRNFLVHEAAVALSIVTWLKLACEMHKMFHIICIDRRCAKKAKAGQRVDFTLQSEGNQEWLVFNILLNERSLRSVRESPMEIKYKKMSQDLGVDVSSSHSRCLRRIN